MKCELIVQRVIFLILEFLCILFSQIHCDNYPMPNLDVFALFMCEYNEFLYSPKPINDCHLTLLPPSAENLDMVRSVKIICYGSHEKVNKTAAAVLPQYKVLPSRLLNVSSVEIGMCPTPNVSYSDIFRKFNISPTSVKNLTISPMGIKLHLRPESFKGLSLPLIYLDNMLDKFHYKLDPKVFEELAVEEMILRKVELKTIPKSRVKKVTFIEGKFNGEFGDCSSLTSLRLERFNVPEITEGWLHSCTNLTQLTLFKLSRKDVEQALMGARTLTELSIEDCDYRYIHFESFAAKAVNLKKLKFKYSDSAYEYLYRNTFNALKKLEELDLSDNQLDDVTILNAIQSIENLRTLIWDRSKINEFCESSYHVSMPGVERLSLQSSKMSSFCFNDWHNLTYLNLYDNNIRNLALEQLPVPRERPLTVNLTENPLSGLFIDENKIIEKFKRSNNITILLNLTMDCDCEHSRSLSYLRELPQISLQNASCTSGESLKEYADKKLDCDKYSCDKCICRTAWEDGATIADCQSKELHTLPEVWSFLQTTSNVRNEPSLKKILASGNSIETLPVLKYPESLTDLDLSNNNIKRISQSTLNFLFHQQRRVKLSGNPFICECETQAMIDAFSRNRDQIPDYMNLTCFNRDSFLHELADRSLCAERALVAFGIVTSSLIALAAITAFIFVRYKLTIKAFLYARGLCLSCVREEELDADREYDAFVSFAHPDDEFVADVLLPGLENDYKLCMHTRNWMPGEMIHTQIMESVQKSRRTIIVLSKSFVESVWGMTEFRTAYSNSLREGRVRVICVVVDDVIDDVNLDSELKSYLKSNTYLKFNDPWFWQKLRYAMPHPSVTSDRNEDEEESRREEVEMASR